MNMRLKERLTVLKSPKIAIPGLLITYLLYAYLMARPPAYCVDEKRVIPKDEMCAMLYDTAIERGEVLLGPTEKNGRDYHANHSSKCNIGTGQTNDFRLGGVFESLFESRLEAFITYEMTDSSKKIHGAVTTNRKEWDEWDFITPCGEIKKRSGV
ncbi:hypothetical protein ACO0LD_28515 [Undibacterium sp. Ji83W]|uniref:hypothetical protein n=1 Tax=Undibacterium sp. Ji83W TaxID=3413043 RepID=UPI003BF2C1C4